MKFRTEISPSGILATLSHERGILMLGSCFSDNIGSLLRRDLFPVAVNPFGPLYNPDSILGALERLEERRPFGLSEIFESGGVYNSFMHHSRFSGTDASKTLDGINSAYNSALERLDAVGTVFVTLGSTRVFRLADTGEVVANCHKLPSSRFREETMTFDEVASTLRSIRSTIERVAPGADVVFTVSPIRHVAYGLEGNSLGKAVLRVGIESIMGMDRTYYFPAYEIMLDDLRDYRFYGPDMIHPTETAVEYIYEKLGESMMTAETRSIARECRRLSQRLAHRVMSDSPEARRFVEDTESLARSLKSKYPFLSAIIQ